MTPILVVIARRRATGTRDTLVHRFQVKHSSSGRNDGCPPSPPILRRKTCSGDGTFSPIDRRRRGIRPGFYWRLRYNVRSPLAYGNPSLIAGLSMKSESLTGRAASNLSGRHVSGGCLCGAVELEIDFPAFWAWHDHSAASRRVHGAAYATYIGCWRKHARVANGRRRAGARATLMTLSSSTGASRPSLPVSFGEGICVPKI